MKFYQEIYIDHEFIQVEDDEIFDLGHKLILNSEVQVDKSKELKSSDGEVHLNDIQLKSK